MLERGEDIEDALPTAPVPRSEFKFGVQITINWVDRHEINLHIQFEIEKKQNVFSLLATQTDHWLFQNESVCLILLIWSKITGHIKNYLINMCCYCHHFFVLSLFNATFIWTIKGSKSRYLLWFIFVIFKTIFQGLKPFPVVC